MIWYYEWTDSHISLASIHTFMIDVNSISTGIRLFWEIHEYVLQSAQLG